MKKNQLKKNGYFIFFICLSFVFLLFISCSTSPLYNVFWGDYSSNQTSMNLIIGKGWSQDLIPYHDLFGTSGPLLYFIQTIGWFLGKRTGIFLLQAVHFSLFLILIFQIMKLFVKEKIALFATCYSLFPYLAMASSGNSDSEWCLTLIALAFYICLKTCRQDTLTTRSCLILGICSGALLMICFRALGIALGILFFVWLYSLVMERDHAFSNILYNLLGMVIIVLPFLIYFAANGAFLDFLQGHVLYNIKELFTGSENLNLILRKVIKSAPSGFLLLVGCMALRKSNKWIGLLFICVSLPSTILLILGQGYWHYYLLYSPFLPIAIGYIFPGLNGKIRKIAISLIVICISVIWLIPTKAFLTYLFTSDMTNLEIAAEDIQQNLDEKQLDQIFIIEKPTALYLALDKMPSYRYFSHQIGMKKVDESISSDTYNYIQNEYTNGILLYGTGWMNEWIGPYQLVTFYTYNRSNMAVYLYNADNMPEDDHEHE